MARDAAATQERIIEAASAEFAAHGIAGARVDEIAARAGVNKRMLYYYFGSKEQLFREILKRKLAERVASAAGTLTLSRGERVADRQATHLEDHDYVRLLMWEALEHGDLAAVEGEDDRRDIYARWVEATIDEQGRGELARDLDAKQFVLSEIALTLFPAAFPQITRLICGVDADDPSFVADRQAFLRALFERLA